MFLTQRLFELFAGTASRETGLPSGRSSCIWTSPQLISCRLHRKHTFSLKWDSLISCNSFQYCEVGRHEKTARKLSLKENTFRLTLNVELRDSIIDSHHLPVNSLREWTLDEVYISSIYLLIENQLSSATIIILVISLPTHSHLFPVCCSGAECPAATGPPASRDPR